MSLRRNMAWVGTSQVAFFMLQFAGSVVVARLLTPYETGVYAVALAIVGILSTVQAFGLAGFVVREAELDDAVMASVVTANTVLCLGLSGAIALLSTLGGIFLKEDGVRRVMLYLALLPLFDILQFAPAAKLERHARFKAIALVGTGRTAISQSVTVAGALCHYSYFSMVYGQIGASIFSAVAFNAIGRDHIVWRLSTQHLRRVASFGVQMLTIAGVNIVAARLAEFALGRVVGLSALGLYSRASNLNNLAWENIHLVIGRVLFTDLASTKRSGCSLRESYMGIIEMVTALLWPAFAGLAIVAGPLILAVYGARWVPASHPLVMLAIAAMFLVAVSMTWEVFVICEETGKQAKIEVLRTSAGLGLFIVGSFINLTCAAAGRIGEAIFSLLIYRPHLDRMTQTRTQDFIPIYLRSGMLTIVAVAPAAALMTYNRASEHTPLVHVVAATIAGFAGWCLTLGLIRHPLAQEASKALSGVKPAILALALGRRAT